MFCLVCFGLTQILVFGSIFDSIRPKTGFLGELLHCPMCTGFWVGVFLFGINGLTELFSFEYNLINSFLLGCLSSGTSYILNMIFIFFVEILIVHDLLNIFWPKRRLRQRIYDLFLYDFSCKHRGLRCT